MNRNVKWDSAIMERHLNGIVYIYARIKRAFANAQILEANLDNAELYKQLASLQRQISSMRKSVQEYMRRAGVKNK